MSSSVTFSHSHSHPLYPYTIFPPFTSRIHFHPQSLSSHHPIPHYLISKHPDLFPSRPLSVTHHIHHPFYSHSNPLRNTSIVSLHTHIFLNPIIPVTVSHRFPTFSLLPPKNHFPYPYTHPSSTRQVYSMSPAT